MIKHSVIVVDDEAASRQLLSSFLTRYCPDFEVVAEAESIREAVGKIALLKPKIVFLDISMPEENGFELFKHFTQPEFYTIFVTAHDEYALQAIKHQALDYILKPISITELVEATERAKTILARHSEKNDISDLLDKLQRNVVSDRLPLPVLEGFVYVTISDIIRCEAEGNYTRFHFVDGKNLLVSKTLGTYEQKLKASGFIRIHHQHLINVAHIEKYHRGRGGIITMTDKSEVSVSQRRKDDLMKKLNIEDER